MAEWHDQVAGEWPARVRLAPGDDLTIPQVVAVARHMAIVDLEGDWRARCERSAEYVRRLVDQSLDRSVDSLADLVRSRFQGRTAPPSIAALLEAPSQDTESTSRLAMRALVYGVTTGFGNSKNRPLRSRAQCEQMQYNMLRSHACGVGPALPAEVVRAAMLLRLRSFIEGHSGVRPELVTMLRECLNARVHPWVPSQGSVGSSGDLCPLAHLAQVLVGEGFAWVGGRDEREPALPAAKALAKAGLSPLDTLKPKEALALTNGTSITTALAALAAYDAAVLLGTANVAAAMSLQALRGCSRALDPRIHAVRRHAGQVRAAADILRFAAGGSLLDTCDDTQDAYSLRCAPQVHGAAGTAIEHAWSVIEQECNAVTDNPLFFHEPDPDREGGSELKREGTQARRHEGAGPPDGYGQCIWDAYAGGNFHGEPVGIAADYLKIAVAELASISERRTQHLLDAHHNRGLPANLCPTGPNDVDRAADASTALNSGLMIAQYTAAALVSENKVLAHPASVDSIPTSANAEDHVAMSPIAARHARQVVENTRNVLGVELVCAAQALEWRLAHAGRPEQGGDRGSGIGDRVGDRPAAMGDRPAAGLSGRGEESETGARGPAGSRPSGGETPAAPASPVTLSPAAAAVLAQLRAHSVQYPAVPFLAHRDLALWPRVASVSSRIADAVVLRCALAAIDRPEAGPPSEAPIS